MAQKDWDAIKALVDDKTIAVHGLVLVHRNSSGFVDIKESAHHDLGRGAKIGAVAGGIVGLIFPPALLATTALGAGIGVGIGAGFDNAHLDEIRDEVETVLLPGSTGIGVFFDDRWAAEVDKALAHADSVTKHDVDSTNVKNVEKTLAGH